MPSLSDIPEELLTVWKLLEFVTWLSSLPVPDNVKRALGHMWIQHTGRKLSNEHWTTIMQNGTHPGG